MRRENLADFVAGAVVAALAVWFVFQCDGLFLKSAPAAPAPPPSSRPRPGRKPGEVHYAILSGGRKIGRGLVTFSMDDGKAVTKIQSSFLWQGDNPDGVRHYPMTVRYVETLDGRPLSLHMEVSGGMVHKLTCTVGADGKVRILRGEGASTKTATADWPEGAILAHGQYLLARRRGLKEGTTFTFRTFNAFAAKQVEVRVRVGPKVQVDLLGQKRELTQVTHTHAPASATDPQGKIALHMDEDLVPRKMRFPGGLTWVACSKAEAIRAPSPGIAGKRGQDPATEPAGGPTLVREMVLPTNPRDGSDRWGSGRVCIRLSPDGEHLYFPRDVRGRFQIAIRNCKTGRAATVPVPLLYNEQVAMVANPFSADGKLLAVSAAIDVDGDGRYRERKEKLQPALYDIAGGKLNRLDVKADSVLATFDASGEHLIIGTMDRGQRLSGKLHVTGADRIQLKLLKLFGIPLGSSPTRTTLVLVKPVFPRKGDRTEWKLVLYDFAKDSQIAELPRNRPFPGLSEHLPQWTADGRYLYYVDGKEDPPRSQSQPSRELYTRVWDTKQNKEVGRLAGFTPVGACGGATTMVVWNAGVSHTSPAMSAFLHDAATGKVTAIAAKSPIQPISTTGKYLLYFRRGLLCRGEIDTGSK